MSEPWEKPGASDEWYTPPEVFNALEPVHFDLDVAAPKDRRNVCVPANHFLDERSLDRPWHGFVWMNPPFGDRDSLSPWLGRFFDHGNGIALTPDRTSAPWFQAAWGRAESVLFTRKIRFIRPDGSRGVSPANGTALWATGDKGNAALIRAAGSGFGQLAVVARTLGMVA